VIAKLGFGFAKTIYIFKAKSLFSHITKTYDTLAFCKRYGNVTFFFASTYVDSFLARDGLERFDGALRELCKIGLVTPYPPLCDEKTCYTAQFEHTIILRYSELTPFYLTSPKAIVGQIAKRLSGEL
jgi:methionine aminopeptidase